MATFKKKNLGVGQFGGAARFGNLTTFRASLTAAAAGALVNTVSDGVPAVSDKIYLQVLPAGFLIEDLQIIVSTAFKAGVTASLGFEYVDGVNHSTVPQDAAYFGAGLALSAVARLRTTSAKELVSLPKEAYLVLTFTGVANDQPARLQVVVHGEREGQV